MKQSLCCLGMYDSKIYLQVNSYVNGFTELYWYKDGTSNVYKVKLPKKDRVVISGLTEGYYIFYTRNPKTTMETEPMTFYFKDDLPSYLINRLWSSANIEASTYTSTLKINLLSTLSATPTRSLLSVLYEAYRNIVDLEEFEEDIFYKLIVCQETYENLQYSSYNRDGVGFARLTVLPSPILTFDDSVETVKVYDISTGIRKLYSVYRVQNGTVTLHLMTGLFEIHLLQDSCLFSILKHCNLSERCMIKLWNDYQSNNMDYLDIIENNLSSSVDLETFTTEEVTMYKEEVGMNPMNAIIPRIQVTEEKYLRGVKLLISGVAFAQASGYKLYVSGRDVEFLSENVQNEFIQLKGTSNTFVANFEPATSTIDKEALLYVINENGTILSRVTRCLFDEDSTTSLAEYYEKIRQAEINSYGRRLSAQVLVSYPEGWSYTQEMITRCIENEEVTIDNVLLQLLSDVYNSPADIDRDLLSVEILKDFISNSNYNLSFFINGNPVWRPFTHTIIGMPSAIFKENIDIEGNVTVETVEDKPYVFRILAKFEGSDNYTEHYVHSFTDQTVEVLLNHYGTYAIYAISESDYTYSGFIYLNTMNGFKKSYLISLEVK